MSEASARQKKRNIWYNILLMNLKLILAELAQYPRGVVEEARKIDWPARKDVLQLTVAALIIMTLATIYIGALDLVFAAICFAPLVRR